MLYSHEVPARVMAVVSDNSGIPIENITPASRFVEDLKMDSLDKIECVMDLEDELDIEFALHEEENMLTVEDAIVAVRKKLGFT